MDVLSSTTSFLLLLFLSLSLSLPSPPPNILILMADDLGFGDVGFYGLRDDVITPTLDRLAGEAVILRNFFTHPMCMPSRGALITGRYPWSWGMTREPRFFNIPQMTFLQQSFLENGYNTSVIGKWDIRVRNDPGSPTFAGFRHFWHHSSASYFNATVHSNHGSFIVEDLTAATGDEAVQFIRQQGSETPFFLWFTPLTPHIPYQVQAEYVAQFEHVDDPLTKTYLALIRAFDVQVERILGALEETGKRENTLILFLSDNGGYALPAGEQGLYRGSKLLSFDGGLRVPAFIHFPSKASAGIIRDSLIIEDLFETLHSAAGLSLPQDNPSTPYRRDFWPLVIGPKDPLPQLPLKALALESHDNTRDMVQDLCCYTAAVRKGRYKLVIESLDCNMTGGPIREPSTLPYHRLVTEGLHDISIFNTFEDPRESQNLISSLRGSPIEGELWDLYQAQAQALSEVYQAYKFHSKLKEHIANLFCFNHEILSRQFQTERKYRMDYLVQNLKVVGSDSNFKCNEFSKAVLALSPAAYWPFQTELGASTDFSGNERRFLGRIDLIPLPRKGFTSNAAASFSKSSLTYVQLQFPAEFTIEMVFLLSFDAVPLVPFQLSSSLQPGDDGLILLFTDRNGIVLRAGDSELQAPNNTLQRRTLNHLVITFKPSQTSSGFSLCSLSLNGQEVLSGELPSPSLEGKLFLVMGPHFELLDELAVYHSLLPLEVILEHHRALSTGCSQPSSLPTEPKKIISEPSSAEIQLDLKGEEDGASAFLLLCFGLIFFPALVLILKKSVKK